MNKKCPICKKILPKETNTTYPFCSSRCKLIDLAAWSSEDYKLAKIEGIEED